MLSGLFGAIPKKESIEKAIKFIEAHPSFSYNQYLRFFIKKYSKKITCNNFVKLLVFMFDILDED